MSQPKPLRVLILTSSTGGGHDARARSLYEWFHKLYASKIEIRIENVLENSSSIGNFGTQLYNFIQKYCPLMHYLYWFAIELLGQLNRFHLWIGRKYFCKLIQSYQPQLIISVHDFLNLGYFKEARKILGKKNVRCATYCGEYSGGFGYSFNWLDKSVDLYFSRTQDAQAFAEKWGIPQQKSFVFFPLLSPHFFTETIQDPASYRKNILGLSPNKFTIFFTTGSNGANNHIQLLNTIKHLHQDVQAIVICGNNKRIYQDLLQWKSSNPSFSLFVEGYSTNVHEYIQVSHAIITKGGSNTVTQALLYQCPIIFNTHWGCMPQEWATIRYFLKHRAARCIRHGKDFCNIITEWKDFGKEYIATKNNLKNALPKSLSPESFIHQLYELGTSTR